LLKYKQLFTKNKMTKTKFSLGFLALAMSLVLSLQTVLAFEWSSLGTLLPEAQTTLEASHDVAPYQQPTALADVINLTAEPIIDGVMLTWDPVAHANMYTIYFGQNSVVRADQNYEEQVMVEAAHTHTISNLTGGTTYYFAVAAEDSTGKYLGSANYSEEISATPLQVPQGQLAATPTVPVVQPVVSTPVAPVVNANPASALPEPIQIDESTLEPFVAATTPAVVVTPVSTTPVSTTPVSTPAAPLSASVVKATPAPAATGKGALPGSGPEVLVVFGISAVGALLMKRKQKKI
jgi:hypothetical protein